MIFTEQEWTAQADAHLARAEERLDRYRNPGMNIRFMISCLSIIPFARHI